MSNTRKGKRLKEGYKKKAQQPEESLPDLRGFTKTKVSLPFMTTLFRTVNLTTEKNQVSSDLGAIALTG